MLEMVIDAAPVFVKVTDCELLDTPTARLPKERLVAERFVCAAAKFVDNRQNIAATNVRTELWIFLIGFLPRSCMDLIHASSDNIARRCGGTLPGAISLGLPAIALESTSKNDEILNHQAKTKRARLFLTRKKKFIAVRSTNPRQSGAQGADKPAGLAGNRSVSGFYAMKKHKSKGIFRECGFSVEFRVVYCVKSKRKKFAIC